jgi:arginyl-tRNA synthetase
MEALEANLSSLNLSTPVPALESVQVLSNPLDIYRTYLAHVLADIANCDLITAHKSIQWPNNIFNGDLAVILPKLRAGAKAGELALELMEKVHLISSCSQIR